MVHQGKDEDTGIYPHYVSPGAQGGKPEIRIARLGSGAALEPLVDYGVPAKSTALWVRLPENPPPALVGIAQAFARVVRDALDVPVGILLVAVPGTNQAAWMSRETLQGFPAGSGQGDFYAEFLAANRAKQAAATTGAAGDAVSVDFPAALYNTRVHPLAPFALRGVIWHQGEAGPGGPYGARLVAMARQWRALFGQELAFVWGTLSRTTNPPPPLTPRRDSFYRHGTSAQIRAALPLFGDDPNVALVELYDLGNDNTHFAQKAEAGRRMGLAALTVAYGRGAAYTGPRLAQSRIEGGTATLTFDQVGAGLAYAPSINGISGFYVRGKAGPPQWGQVEVLDARTLKVSHPDIAELATVAYGAYPNPHETLFNDAGLPASPFAVNSPRDKDPAEPVSLLALSDPQAAAELHVVHVRRQAYVFRVLPKEGKGLAAPVQVKAFVPAEWAGVEVESGGAAIAAQASADAGERFLTFVAPGGGAWIIVAEKGHAADFRNVNRY